MKNKTYGYGNDARFFFRAVSLVSIAALISAPIIFLALFIGKVISKIFGIYPVVGIFRKKQKENQKKKVAKLMAEGMDEE